MKYNLTLFFFLSIHLSSLGQQTSAIDKKWIKFTTTENTASQEKHGVDYYLLKVEAGTKKSQIRKLGFQVARQLDKMHFVVSPLHINQKSYTGNYTRVNDLWKLSPPLLAKITSKKTNEIAQKLTLHTSALIELVNWANAHDDIEVTFSSPKRQIVLVKIHNNTVIDELLHHPSVTFIGEQANEVKVEARLFDMNLNINGINLVHHNSPSINGDGVNVSVKEEKYDTLDADLKGRHTPSDLSAPGMSSHATEMATIIAGAGNTSETSKGVAWGSQLLSSDFSSLIPDEDTKYESLGVNIQNHSYGTGIENFYGAEAMAFDLNANSIPTLLHIYSVGNIGTSTDTDGPYAGAPGFANITGNFKMSKNNLLIGSVDRFMNIDPIVSKGPAYDGRVKPELVAYSTLGSSNAAALTSGIVALLQQSHKASHSGQPAESALIKGLLINTADDVGPEGIDFSSGYGNINAHKALTSLQENQYFADELNDGEEVIFNISVPVNASSLKVTLTWNDPAANANAGTALINDIDLSLTNASNTWLPWVLNPYPLSDSLNKPPVRSEDRLNNVEQITLSNPENGNYTIKIAGFDIPEGPQEFFVTYHWELQDTFTWAFPSGSDNMPHDGESTNIFRWKSSYTDQTGHLQISFDEGNNWQTIATDIPLSQQYYEWNEEVTNGTAIARMVIDGSNFDTDIFTLGFYPEISVGFNCTDSVMLQWKKVENATSFNIYTIGEKYLDPTLVANDTFSILNKADYPQELYAIAPVYANGKEGVRTFTFDYRLQGVDCYLSVFYAGMDEDSDDVKLYLQIGTSYQVESISFEKFVDNSFQSFEVLNNITGTNITATDNEPNQGFNLYQAKITFANGETITTDPSEIYYLTELPIIVFPNPVRQFELLNIFTKQFEVGEVAQFQIINPTGQVVLETPLYSDRESINILNLNQGLYYFRLLTENLKASGRIVVIK